MLDRGETAAGRFLILRFLAEPVERTEAAYIVSRKVGKAVARNKIKRRLRELFRDRRRSSMAPGYYLFIARTASSEATFGQLRDDMYDLVGRAAAMTTEKQPKE